MNTCTSDIQTRAEEMMRAHGFLGVPTDTFAEAGHRQFVALLNEGMNADSRVLEIGCGCLRAGYWLVRFLGPENYHGIEPARQRVEYGLQYLFTEGLVILKRPRFDFNARFDTSVFNTSFHFFLAGSIWAHATKQQISTMLDSFVRDSTPHACFLASYLPAQSRKDDYQGSQWIGTSHESATPGVIRHSLDWIDEQCQERGLRVDEIAGEAFDGQCWLRVRRVES